MSSACSGWGAGLPGVAVGGAIVDTNPNTFEDRAHAQRVLTRCPHRIADIKLDALLRDAQP